MELISLNNVYVLAVEHSSRSTCMNELAFLFAVAVHMHVLMHASPDVSVLAWHGADSVCVHVFVCMCVLSLCPAGHGVW